MDPSAPRPKPTAGVLQTPLGRHPDCCIPSASLPHLPPATQHTASPSRPPQCRHAQLLPVHQVLRLPGRGRGAGAVQGHAQGQPAPWLRASRTRNGAGGGADGRGSCKRGARRNGGRACRREHRHQPRRRECVTRPCRVRYGPSSTPRCPWPRTRCCSAPATPPTAASSLWCTARWACSWRARGATRRPYTPTR